MRPSWRTRVVLILALIMPAVTMAGLPHPLYLQLATYTHYSSSSDHSGPPILAAAELHHAEDRFVGVSLFDNSFGQFSQFIYYGWQFPLDWIHEGVRAKLPVGLVHGYRGEHKHDIPLNGLGVAPAVLPAIGYQRGRWGGDIVLLGKAAVLFSVGYRFGD